MFRLEVALVARSGSVVDEALDRARELLSEGEQIVGALCVTYGGKLNRYQAPTGLAAEGMGDGRPAVLVGEVLAKRYEESGPIQFPAAPQMIVVLTDRRILCWSRGGLKGRPKSFLGEVELAAISAVRREEGRYQDRLTLTMRSGWEVVLESQKGTTEEFAASLSSRLG
ncbi:MAG: hypothetical protein KatS3mg008_1846 [Acidimicrobiales bacterium]|nr:MAG: hypothetical protein KatS3mg008_1846 [Acidimicrobiales bacterium]